MEALNRFIRENTLLAVLVVFVVGFIVGWILMGWVIWPVEYENAGPVNLNPVYQVEWVEMTADSFALNLDLETAQDRMALMEDQNAAFDQALTFTEGESQLRVAQLQQALQSAGGLEPGGGQVGEEGVEEGEAGGFSVANLIRPLLIVCGVVLLLVIIGGGGVYLLRQRSGGDEYVATEEAAYEVEGLEEVDVPTTEEYVGEVSGAPIAQFMTTYMLGDDLYDDSFSIDDANGDFLGECGVGISETVGVGDPKKVTAFEVRLFDKNDIRTVTKVLMSENAFMDEALKSRLAAKGEPVLGQPGETLVLETATLNVVARIVDMQYGDGPLPPNSFFQQLTIELAAWKKNGEQETAM